MTGEFDREVNFTLGNICYFTQMIGFFAIYFGSFIYFFLKSDKQPDQPEQPSEDE